jgi:hypothetical protein
VSRIFWGWGRVFVLAVAFFFLTGSAGVSSARAEGLFEYRPSQHGRVLDGGGGAWGVGGDAGDRSGGGGAGVRGSLATGLCQQPGGGGAVRAGVVLSAA